MHKAENFWAWNYFATLKFFCDFAYVNRMT